MGSNGAGVVGGENGASRRPWWRVVGGRGGGGRHGCRRRLELRRRQWGTPCGGRLVDGWGAGSRVEGRRAVRREKALLQQRVVRGGKGGAGGGE